MTDRFRPDAALLPLLPPEDRRRFESTPCASCSTPIDPSEVCERCAPGNLPHFADEVTR